MKLNKSLIITGIFLAMGLFTYKASSIEPEYHLLSSKEKDKEAETKASTTPSRNLNPRDVRSPQEKQQIVQDRIDYMQRRLFDLQQKER